MSAVLPDEFPFQRISPAPRNHAPEPIVAEPIESQQLAPPSATPPARRAEPAAPAPKSASIAPPATAAASAPIALPIEEPLLEIPAPAPIHYRGPERRRSPRQALRAKAIYRAELGIPGAIAHPEAVQVSNMSMLGVRFWSRIPLTPGAKGALRVEIGPMRWGSLLRIISSIPCPDDDGYLIGCQMIGNEIKRRRTDAA